MASRSYGRAGNGGGGVSAWDEARVGALMALWNEGKSARQVAHALGGGVTRNAVIGKLHRIGMVGKRTADRRSWSGSYIQRRPPTPPRSFSWEQHT